DQDSARPGYIAYHINDISLADNDCVPGKYLDIGLWSIGQVPAQRKSDWLVRLVAMRNRNAASGPFRKAACSRDQVEKTLLAKPRIDRRPGDLPKHANAL